MSRVAQNLKDMLDPISRYEVGARGQVPSFDRNEVATLINSVNQALEKDPNGNSWLNPCLEVAIRFPALLVHLEKNRPEVLREVLHELSDPNNSSGFFAPFVKRITRLALPLMSPPQLRDMLLKIADNVGKNADGGRETLFGRFILFEKLVTVAYPDDLINRDNQQVV